MRILFHENIVLNLLSPIPQNGQTHSNNSSAVGDKLFECVWPFCGIGVKGLTHSLPLKMEIINYCSDLASNFGMKFLRLIIAWTRSQLAFTCSKSAMEKPDQCVKSVQS